MLTATVLGEFVLTAQTIWNDWGAILHAAPIGDEYTSDRTDRLLVIVEPITEDATVAYVNDAGTEIKSLFRWSNWRVKVDFADQMARAHPRIGASYLWKIDFGWRCGYDVPSSTLYVNAAAAEALLQILPLAGEVYDRFLYGEGLTVGALLDLLRIVQPTFGVSSVDAATGEPVMATWDPLAQQWVPLVGERGHKTSGGPQAAWYSKGPVWLGLGACVATVVVGGALLATRARGARDR